MIDRLVVLSPQILTALGKSWHPEHFVCSVCSQPITEGSFNQRDGMPVCSPCYVSKFTDICHGCNQPILGVKIAFDVSLLPETCTAVIYFILLKLNAADRHLRLLLPPSEEVAKEPGLMGDWLWRSWLFNHSRKWEGEIKFHCKAINCRKVAQKSQWASNAIARTSWTTWSTFQR